MQKKASTKNDGFIYASIEAPEEIIPELKPIPKENRLVIPKISVDGEINTGGKESLDKGLWLRPDTSNPSLGGNTVIVAHRFLYSSGPITFYHLDKMKKMINSVFIGKEKNMFIVFMIYSKLHLIRSR